MSTVAAYMVHMPFLHLLPAQPVLTRILHDATQPGGKRFRIAEFCKPAVGSHEGILCDILRLLPVVHKTECCRKYRILIPVNQWLKRIDVAIQTPPNQLRVFFV